MNSLPLYHRANELVGGREQVRPECPFHHFSKTWLATTKNVSFHEMMIAVVALKRYQLRHGTMPDQLTALVPDYVKPIPRDLVDGQPLRY